MKITTSHPASSYGQPVILADDGELMDYSAGVKSVREQLGLTVPELAAVCGVAASAVYGWQSGRLPNAASLNVMRDLLEALPRK